MNLTVIALMNLSATLCGRQYPTLPWFYHECQLRLNTCFQKSVTETDVETCKENQWKSKICDPAGECF